MRILLALLFVFGVSIGCDRGVEEFPPPTGRSENNAATPNQAFVGPNKPNIRFSKDVVQPSPDAGDEEEEEEEEEEF